MGIYWEVLRSGSQRYISTLVFIAALLTIAKMLKQLKWNKKIWQIYTTEYYSAFKMREILQYVIPWVKLEIYTKQNKPVALHNFTSVRVAKIIKSIGAESRVVVTRGWREGGCTSNNIKFQLGKMNTFYSSVEHHCACSYQYFIIHLKMCLEGRSHVVSLL